MSRYIISVLACEDLSRITDYFAEHNIEAGERLLRLFDRKCRQLATLP